MNLKDIPLDLRLIDRHQDDFERQLRRIDTCAELENVGPVATRIKNTQRRLNICDTLIIQGFFLVAHGDTKQNEIDRSARHLLTPRDDA